MKRSNFIKSSKLFGMFLLFALISGSEISAGENKPVGQENLLPSELQKIIASDGLTDDAFGTDTAIAGDTVIVGASGDDIGANNSQGSAYIFVKTNNVWTQQAKITANDGAAGDSFGNSVAIAGDTVIVGARNDLVGANNLQGSAYIFTRSGTTWTQQAKLTANDGASGDNFGADVSIAGETAIVGAPGDDIGALNSLGSAYVYTRTGAVWSQQTKLLSNDTANSDLTGDQFGGSVNISDNTVIVGVGFDSIGASAYQGSAYIFVRNGTNWTQQTRLIAADGAAGDGFGRSSAISGDTVIIASLSDDIAANTNQGSAYIYVRTGTTWSEQAKLIANDGQAQDFFGNSVAIEGNTAIVSSTQDTVGANAVQGSAYLYVRNGTNWTQREKFTASDGAAGDGLGISVSVSGNNTVVGSPGDDINPNSNQGSAYLFSNLVQPKAFDFDGDGKADISVFRPSNRVWYASKSSDNGILNLQWGLATDKLAPGDYNGDGKTDYVVVRDGFWYILYNGGTVEGFQLGAASDIPAPADYDGDGKTDAAIFRNGLWAVRNSSTGGTTIFTFGSAGDIPTPADFDGDNKADYAVWRSGAPMVAAFQILQSNGGFRTELFGQTGDVPVVADYDGDGKSDPATYRAGAQSFFYYRGSLNNPTNNVTYLPWGITGDIPAPADYDGDGKTDIAVFRNGIWYILRTTGGVQIFNFGLTGDKPVPSAFVP